MSRENLRPARKETNLIQQQLADKFDFLDVADNQTAYLDDSVVTLRLLTEDLDRVIHGWMNDPVDYPMDWVLNYCSGFYVVLRSLERIHHDLDTAVTKEYENRRNKNGNS